MGRFMRRLVVAIVFVVTTAGFASPAFAASTRTVTSPGASAVTPVIGSVPAYRTAAAAPRLVVCRPGASLTGLARTLAAECRYHEIQRAVDAVRARGTTIYVLPGTYHEPSALGAPKGRCAALADSAPLSYDDQRACPHLQSLISVTGQSDLQIEGVGGPVIIEGGKQVGIRALRSDGFYLRGVTVRGFTEDGISVGETNGFVLDQVTGLTNGEHGLAAYASDHGLITDCAASGNGDAGIATASASDQQGGRLSIEVRRCTSSGNLIGFSGTAGDSVYVHDNVFKGNSTGAMVDSSVQAAGMPQNHAMFVANRVFGNNADLYRDCRTLCPRRAVPVGTGMLLAGGDQNTYASNMVYDNWRYGFAQYWIPASRRGETDPAKARDTSHDNHYVGNLMGVTPEGAPAPNGVDFWWDEQGDRNCWQSNATPQGGPRTDPVALPACDRPSAGGPYVLQGNPVKTAEVTACAAYRPGRPAPAGCTWLSAPRRP
jgi:parallel beta helix pectate lyase-like protein